MGSKEKLIERFKKLPKDFTFEESASLLGYFGYRQHTKAQLPGHVYASKMKKPGSG